MAESFETAINLSDGLAIVSFMDARRKDMVFSARFSCPECGYSIEELSSRLFSFNNPAGACPDCDGLGVKQFFDPDRVVHQKDLSLSAGALRGWDRKNVYYFNMLTSLAEHYGFDLNKPFAKLPKKIREMVLYGSGDEKIEFRYFSEKNQAIRRKHTFEGVIPNMQRRYHETESQAVREDLVRYLSVQQCPLCDGARLCESARNVFVEGYSIAELTGQPIGEVLPFFETLSLSGARGEIAEKIQKELVARLGFLVNVGLEYLTLDRSADTLSGGEAQRIRLASQIGSGLVGVLYILDEPSIGLHQRDNERFTENVNTFT